MSKSTNQSMVQLSVVAGCMNTLKQTNSFARVDIRRLLDQLLIDIATAMLEWPCTGDEQKNSIWIKERRDRWKKFIFDDPDEVYGSAALAKMAERILFAMDEVTRDAKKRRLLAPIYEASMVINRFCDPQGANFPAYEKSDYLLDELYRLIEWREYV
jgi:hypothetical protein